MHTMQHQNGMSLIETMVSLIILGFGLIAIAGMQYSMTAGDQLSRQRSVAVLLAQSKVEEIRGGIAQTLTTDVCSSSAAASGSSCPTILNSSASFTRTWTTIPAADGTRIIDVQVVWDDLTLKSDGTHSQTAAIDLAGVSTNKDNIVEIKTQI